MIMMLDELRKRFDGKSVAIVGNSKSLLSRNHGKLIDSHEIVCRMNRGFVILPPTKTDGTYKRTHGDKTTHLFVNLIHTAGLSKKCLEQYDVIQTTHCKIRTKWINKTGFSFCPEIMVPFVKQFAPQKASTGIRILFAFSLISPAKVSVFGFDWKKTPSFFGARENTGTAGHDFEKEQQYCHEHFFTLPNWTLFQ